MYQDVLCNRVIHFDHEKNIISYIYILNIHILPIPSIDCILYSRFILVAPNLDFFHGALVT